MQKLRLFGMNGVFALILACTAGVARGQQAGYLILIDAENKQPFTARIGETLMQSTAHGHLLISQLKDSIYRVAIRFPHNPDPDQVFPVNMRKKDQGLQLKGSEDSWVLYNWQSRETIRPLKEVDSSRLLERGIKREDGFSSLMAAVVNDSSVMYNTFTWNNLPESSLKGLAGADSTGAPAGNKILTAGFHRDSAGVAKKNKKNRAAQPSDSAGIAKSIKTSLPDSVKSKEVVKTVPSKSQVKKLREVSLKVSRKMVFQDISPEGEKDTITLFVYFEKPEPVAKRPHEDPMVTARRLLRNDTVRKKQNMPEKEIRPVAKEGLVKNTGNDSLKKEQQPPKADVRITAPKQVAGCSEQATDTDAATLRSAILVRNTEDEKISVSSEAFSIKCFSVGQLRQLADLFVSEKARFRFLSAAHGHVSDGDRFQELADLFPGKTYLKKFRTLARKPG